jgi:hypothetical protein
MEGKETEKMTASVQKVRHQIIKGPRKKGYRK